MPLLCGAHDLLYLASGGTQASILGVDDPGAIADPRTRAVVEWALARRTPSSPVPRTPPFSADAAPELLTRVVVFEYLNRTVTVLLDRSPLPDSAWVRRLVTSGVLLRLSRALGRNTAAGASLEFVATAAELPGELRWADSHPVLGRAMAAFHHTTTELGKQILPEAIRGLVREHVWARHGQDMGLSRRWVEDAVAAIDVTRDGNVADAMDARLAFMTRGC